MAIIHYTGYCPVCKKYQTKEKICSKCSGALRRCSKWLETYRVIESGKIKQKKSKMYDTKGELEKISAARKLAIQDVSPASITFEQLKEAFFIYKDQQGCKDSTYVTYESRINTKIEPILKGKIMAEINLDDLTEIKSSIAEYSNNYKAAIWDAVGMLFNFARRKFKIHEPYDLYLDEAKLKTSKIKRGFWHSTQWKTFINKVEQCINEAKTEKERDAHYVCFILFYVLYYDGNRKGEATALRVKHLHLDEETPICSVEDNISYKLKKINRDKGLTYLITTPKTGDTRDIKIPPILVDLLKDYIKYFDLKDDDFLFFKNKPIPPQTLRDRFDFYINLAEVKRITPHQLRHSNASLVFSKGKNTIAAAYAVAKRSGNSVKYTLDTYGDLFSDEEDKILEIISNG